MPTRPVTSYPTRIKKRMLASCGEDGLTIWDEHTRVEYFTYEKQEKWAGKFRSCLWHPQGKMIAAGTISGIEDPQGYVYIWNYNHISDKWDEQSRICIKGSTDDVVGLSWIENKLLCCTTDGHFYVILVEMGGSHRVLATHYDNINAEINCVKWHLGNSNYFICGGHRGLEIYHFNETPQEFYWNIKKVAVRTSTTAAAGICFDPNNSDGSEFIVFKFSGGIRTWELNITKDYMGCDLISLNIINMHGKRRSLEGNISTSTKTYFSFDWNCKTVKEDRYMVLGCEDGKIEVYACDYFDDDYHSIGESTAHTDIVSCVKWSPSVIDEMFASASLDGSIKFWMIDDTTDYTCRD